MIREEDIGSSLVGALLTAGPFCNLALVIVAVAGQTIAVWTEWDAILIETALQTGLRILITLRMAQADGAQGVQLVIHVTQHVFDAFGGVAQHFPNLKRWETLPKCVETGDGQQVVVDVGGSKRAGE